MVFCFCFFGVFHHVLTFTHYACLLLALFCIAVEKRLVEEVQKNDVLIIVGETGSGKTTRRLHLILVVVIVVMNL